MNPLLEIDWNDVRLLSIDGSEVSLVLAETTVRLKFESRDVLEENLREWCAASATARRGKISASKVLAGAIPLF